MNIELRHLRYFTAVAEESSFTGAARRMHVAQQVLSAQVRQLEDTLVRADGVPPTAMCLAWRADDANRVVHRFAEVITEHGPQERTRSTAASAI